MNQYDIPSNGLILNSISSPSKDPIRKMRKILISTFFFLATGGAYCQCQDFFFTKLIKDANFINDRIANVDDYLLANDVPIDSVFAIQNGAFDIVLFERYVYGESVLEDYSFFHEAIILKVYEGTIIESFFLSYDWKEPPMSTPIQVSHKKLPIERVMETSDFDFKLLNEFGHNLLEDDCKIIIPDNVDFLHGSRRQINETE